MNLFKASLALILGAGMAMAQSTGAPAGGTGSTPPPAGGGAGSGGAVPSDLDLPLEKPLYQPPAQPTPTPPPNPPIDPTDVPGNPPTIFGEEIVSENDTLYYVLDISGSMDWDPMSYTSVDGQRRNGPRIDRAKAELIRSILGLSENFKFNIIAFDCGTLQWMNQLMPANDANKQSAIGWANALYPRGATGTGPATCLALGDRENKTVVLLTDGAPNCGADGTLNGHRRLISSNNSQGAKINVFGIAASGSYRSFCQGVASDSGGAYVDVP